jgi:hypothetical protein
MSKDITNLETELTIGSGISRVVGVAISVHTGSACAL